MILGVEDALSSESLESLFRRLSKEHFHPLATGLLEAIDEEVLADGEPGKRLAVDNGHTVRHHVRVEGLLAVVLLQARYCERVIRMHLAKR